MNEDSSEWYYTTGVDQGGPVSFDELKAKAAAAELHPRNDMVWKQSMDEWVPAGQIDGLFEKRATDPAADALASSISAMEGSKPQGVEETVLWPGASRRWYMLLVLLFPILWVVLCMAFAAYFGSGLSPGFQKLFMLIGLIVPFWVVIDVSLSRLSNLGMNKLWFFLNFVPVANLWLGYRTFACPAGYAKNKKLDPIGWILAMFYWLFMISCVAVAILVPAMIDEVLQDEELLRKIENLRGQVESTTGGKESEPDKPAEPQP